MVVCLALFVFYGYLTLSHTLLPPCGLGVFGGKAKLLHLAGGVPPELFTDRAWESFQPAYPPGVTLLMLGCYGFANACGEYLTQLMMCAFTVLCMLYILSRSPWRGYSAWAIAGWVAGFFFGIQLLRMATSFYAEPLLALLLLIGWGLVSDDTEDSGKRNRRVLLGYILLGGCGWIKNEGILFLPAVWCVRRVFCGTDAAHVSALLMGLVLPVAWMVYARVMGATLYDYAPLYQVDVQQAGMACQRIFQYAFLEPWRYGFVYPLVCVLLLFPRFRTKGFATGVCAAGLCLIGFVWIFSISRAPDMDWHLTSLERLLWCPAVLLLSLCVAKR